MINLCLVGFNESTTKSLGIALRSRAKEICALSEIEHADVALVDIDEMQDEDQWRALHREHQLAMIAVSRAGEVPVKYAKEFPLSIRKPLRFSELLTSVGEAAELDREKISDIQKGSQAGTYVADVKRDSLSKVVRSDELISADNYLLGRVLSAVRSGSEEQCRLIQWWSGEQWLVIDKKQDKVFLNVKSKKFRRVAILGMDDLELTEEWIPEGKLKKLRKKASWECSIEEFVWMLTQYTARSGGIDELSLDTPYRLKHWPNLPRYSTSEKDLPLSSYWIENESSVNGLMEKFDLPSGDVLVFASCCLATGLLQNEASNDEALAVQAAPEPIRKKGLKKVLSMILTKLAA